MSSDSPSLQNAVRPEGVMLADTLVARNGSQDGAVSRNRAVDGDAVTRTLLNELNGQRISSEDLISAASAMGRLPERLRTWHTRRARMARIFPDQARKVEAIDFRIRAMVRVTESDVFRAWTSPGSDQENASVHEPLWRAAATEPLVWDGIGVQLGFDPAAFLLQVLLLSPARGTC